MARKKVRNIRREYQRRIARAVKWGAIQWRGHRCNELDVDEFDIAALQGRYQFLIPAPSQLPYTPSPKNGGRRGKKGT